MRETVVVQVGQAGNQIGGQLWSEFLKEHETARFRTDAEASDALSAFFRIRYHSLFIICNQSSLLLCIVVRVVKKH